MSQESDDLREIIDACVEFGNSAAWQEFIRRFHKLIANIVLRTAERWGEHSREVIDDLIQETYLKLCAGNCRILREFQNHHQDSIYGYLKVITANLVNDHFRSATTEKRGKNIVMEDAEEVEPLADPHKPGSALTMERQILLDQIDSCLRDSRRSESPDRDRLIFKMYFREGLSAPEIAAIPAIGLSIKGVESAILRITRLLRMELGEGRKPERALEKSAGTQEGFAGENTSC